MVSRPIRMSAWLALGTLVAATLVPPEAYGEGRMLLVLSASTAFLVLVMEREIPGRYLAVGLAGLVLLTAHSLLLSEDPYRSVEFLGLLWAYYCLGGVFRYYPGDLRYKTACVLILLAAAVSVYGLYQFFWGFDELHALVESSQADDTIRLPILGRIESARVFATFALPGTLWGFLLLTLPLHAAIWKPGKRLPRALLIPSGVLIVGVAALTQSYGFVIGLATAMGGWLLTRQGARALGPMALKAALLVTAFGGLILLLYGARMSSHNPVWLRLQNWLSAWEMFATHPLGAGLNAYASLYLRYQQPGANETQFAHNTVVQLIAELGVFGLLAVLLGTLYLVRHRKDARRLTGVRRALFIALIVWGVHNLIDIDVYFGSVGAIGAALTGLFLWKERRVPPEPAEKASRALVGATSVAAFLVLASSALVFVSGEFLLRGRTELEFLRNSDAAVSLGIAARINPFDPTIRYEAGQAELERYYATLDGTHLDAARAHLMRAIWLSPHRVGPHVSLALVLASGDRMREAIDELEIAQMIHPEDGEASNIRRLMEKRQAEP